MKAKEYARIQFLDITGCEGKPQPQEPGVIPLNVVSCNNLNMDAIAQTLRQMAGGYITAPGG
jgi:hypothetical protein